ncbi:MAG: DMT family transporter [Enterobacteriaceae bacterium]
MFHVSESLTVSILSEVAMNRIASLVYVVACVLAWSLIPLISKIATTDLSPLQFLLWSNVLSTAAIFIVAWPSLRKKQNVEWRKAVRITCFPGFLGCFFYYACLYYAYSKSNGISVLVMQYTWPIWLVLLSPCVTKEKFNKRSLLICRYLSS